MIHFSPLFSTENHFEVYKHQRSQQEEIKTKRHAVFSRGDRPNSQFPGRFLRAMTSIFSEKKQSTPCREHSVLSLNPPFSPDHGRQCRLEGPTEPPSSIDRGMNSRLRLEVSIPGSFPAAAFEARLFSRQTDEVQGSPQPSQLRRDGPACRSVYREGTQREVSASAAPFVCMTSDRKWELAFGVRRWVSKSTCTIPNRFEYPKDHSKLSSRDQAK